MSLPPEKFIELKQIIHDHLIQNNINGIIQNTISEYEEQTFSEQDLFDKIKSNGVLRQIFNTLKLDDLNMRFSKKEDPISSKFFDETNEPKEICTSFKKVGIDPIKRHLMLRICSGRSFTEHLNIENYDNFPLSKVPFFVFDISFRGQRFRSKPVLCSVEPRFDESFLFELQKNFLGPNSKMADTTGMLSMSEQIHLSLIRIDEFSELVSSHSIDWRFILHNPSSSLQKYIELKGIGCENGIIIGMVEIQLQLSPKLQPNEIIKKELLNTQLSLELLRKSEIERSFLAFTKRWWKEYIEIRPQQHDKRYVQIYAQNENGHNDFVCSYVNAMVAGRLIESPKHAARFVSLIDFDKASKVGVATRTPSSWNNLHSFLATKNGDVIEHCLLLCSLLLGFGLDAYVCLGTKLNGEAHSWVMSLSLESKVTFWESLTAARYPHNLLNRNEIIDNVQSSFSYPYKTIGSVFNNKLFFANCQPSDAVELTKFNLSDEGLWKCIPEEMTKAIIGVERSSLPPLTPPTLDHIIISDQLEQNLKTLIAQHRLNQGLSTSFDSTFSYYLSPALAAYESERITGSSVTNEDFEQVIKRSVPEGHTFKGFPMQCKHRDPHRILHTCLKSSISREIIDCRGDQLILGLRTRVFVYPDDICATWVMLACKYKSIV